MRAALLLSAALLIVSPAYAQQNDQYQGADAAATTDVVVDEAYNVGGTAVASGNVVTAISDDADAQMENVQHMDGDATAHTEADIGAAYGTVNLTSAAIANGATADLSDSNVEINSSQLAHGDASASVNHLGGVAGAAATSASASGNVTSISAQNSELRLLSEQESTGSISAAVTSDQYISGQAISGAIASANNFTVGSETATVLTDLRQSATGDSVEAAVNLHADHAYDVSGNATANANAATIDNQWGYVNARIDQTATADVNADSVVTLGANFEGFASSGAYGVGNQAIVSNVGSDTVMDIAQANGGDISANAETIGAGGGEYALASSAAYGNSITGYVCGYCDVNVPSLTPTSTQTNNGAVTSTAAVRSNSYVDTVGATSTAIGNAATYSVAGPGG